MVIKNVGQWERRVMVLNFFELAIEYRTSQPLEEGGIMGLQCALPTPQMRLPASDCSHSHLSRV